MTAEIGAEQVGEMMIALAQGDLELAELTGIDTSDKVKILQYGIAQMKSGMNDKAVAILEGLVTLDRQTPLFLEYLGMAYERSDRLDDALSAYDRNLDGLDAGETTLRLEGHLLRARVQLKRGETDRAKADLAAAAALDQGAEPRLSQELAFLQQAAGGAS